MINIYNYHILLFNLLPIYPLDGGKLINLFLCNRLTFILSYYLSIIISLISLVVILILNRQQLNFNIFFLEIFLFLKIIKEYHNLPFLYQKFLLDRYLNDYHFNDTKIIKNINNFYCHKNHLLNIENKYIWEKDFLKKIYKKC